MAGESKLQIRCKAYASARSVLFRKLHAENRNGWPDVALIFPVSGETVWVEMKNPNGKGTLGKLQASEYKKLKARKANVYACDSFDFFREIIKLHLKPKVN